MAEPVAEFTGQQEESGEKKGRGEARFKLSVFYSHLISFHSEKVREMNVSELPGDKDCLKLLQRFFEEVGQQGEDIKVKVAELLGVKKSRKRKVREEDSNVSFSSASDAVNFSTGFIHR